MIVLDTNVVYEIMKPAPSEKAVCWLASQESSSVFITAITQAKILYGIEVLPWQAQAKRLRGVFCPLTRSPGGSMQEFVPVARLSGCQSLNLMP